VRTIVRLDAANAAALIADYDLVIDCSDNFATRFLLNDMAMRLNKPVILASVYQYEGQLQVVRARPDAACLRCVWPEAHARRLDRQLRRGGRARTRSRRARFLQALEALKLLLDLPGQLGDEVLIVNLLTLSSTKLRTQRAPECRGRACVHVNIPQEDSFMHQETLEVAFSSLDDAAAEGYVVVDVREPKELEAWPTPCGNARHIPMRTLLYGDSGSMSTANISSSARPGKEVLRRQANCARAAWRRLFPGGWSRGARAALGGFSDRSRAALGPDHAPRICSSSTVERPPGRARESVRSNADLGAHAEFPAVRELSGRVVQHDGAVDLGEKTLRGAGILRHDGFGVGRSVLPHVRDRGIEALNDAHRE